MSRTPKTKIARVVMYETHRVEYEVEVDGHLSEDQVAGMINRGMIDLDNGIDTDMPDWNCTHVEFLEAEPEPND